MTKIDLRVLYETVSIHGLPDITSESASQLVMTLIERIHELEEALQTEAFLIESGMGHFVQHAGKAVHVAKLRDLVAKGVVFP